MMNIEFDETLQTGNADEGIRIIIITDYSRNDSQVDSASIEIGECMAGDADFAEWKTYSILAAEQLHTALGVAIKIAKDEVNKLVTPGFAGGAEIVTKERTKE